MLVSSDVPHAALTTLGCLFVFFPDFCFPPPHRNCFIYSFILPHVCFLFGGLGGISIFSICLPVPIFVFLCFIFPPLCLCPSLAAYAETEDATEGCRREKKIPFIIIDLFSFSFKNFWYFLIYLQIANTVCTTDLTTQKHLMCLINGRMYSFN